MTMRTSQKRACSPVLLATAAVLTVFGAADALAEPGTVSAEMNRLEDVEGGCRLSFVFTNGLPDSIETLGLETVLFDAEDRIERFLLLRTRPLAAGNVRVQQFDVRDLACERIGRVLLNDVTECEGDGLDPAGCLALVVPSSRSDVPFASTFAAAASE